MNNTVKANFYIDGNFAYHYYKHLRSIGRTINWNALKTYILDKIEKKEAGEAVFDQCHYFMGISSQQEELERKLFKTSLADSRFSQISLSLKSAENHSGFKEDAIDTTLVLTAQEEAYSAGYDYAVLFAGDSDLAPLPYFLKKKGIKTILVYCDIESSTGGIATKTSLKLQQECFEHVCLNDLLTEELRQVANLQRRALLVNFDFPDLLERLVFPQIKSSINQPKAEDASRDFTSLEQKKSSLFTPISPKSDVVIKTVESEEEDWFGSEAFRSKTLNVIQTDKTAIESKILARRKGTISNIISRSSNKSIFIHTSDVYGDFYAQMPDDWDGQINDEVEFDVTQDYNPSGLTNYEKNGHASNIVITRSVQPINITNAKPAVTTNQSTTVLSRIPTSDEICIAIQQLHAQKDSEGYVYVNELGLRLRAIMGCSIAGKLKETIVQYPDLFETQDKPAYRIRKRTQKSPIQDQVFKSNSEIHAAQGECCHDFRKQNADVYAGMDCLEQGKLVTGKISQVNDQEVLIDVNYKSEGVIDRGEFKDTDSLEIGSEIEVFVEKLEDEDGHLILSKQKADFVRVWDRIHAAFENNEIVRGTLTKRVKGGVVVDLFGIDAFLPCSQIDLRQIPDINALIGQEFDFKVIKVNKVRRNIVVSRRVILEEEHNKQHGDVLKTFAPLQSTLQLSRNIHLHNQIKPIDWAVANGVKVDLVMKLLRDAGVSVRTHMSKVDAQDYAKIKEAVVLEKEKHVIQNANLEKNKAFLAEYFNHYKK